MKTVVANGIVHNRTVRIAFAAVALLLVPLAAMQFTGQVKWTLQDFVAAGILLFMAGLVLDLITRRVRVREHRIIAVSVLVAVFLYVWAELAVGIFTHWGS